MYIVLIFEILEKFWITQGQPAYAMFITLIQFQWDMRHYAMAHIFDEHKNARVWISLASSLALWHMLLMNVKLLNPDGACRNACMPLTNVKRTSVDITLVGKSFENFIINNKNTRSGKRSKNCSLENEVENMEISEKTLDWKVDVNNILKKLK